MKKIAINRRRICRHCRNLRHQLVILLHLPLYLRHQLLVGIPYILPPGFLHLPAAVHKRQEKNQHQYCPHQGKLTENTLFPLFLPSHTCSFPLRCS